MEFIDTFWGYKEPLNTLQMACRGLVTFVIALVILRVSGRRSFGVGTPLDNIVVILVGAILSRGVIGASPFLPVVITGFVIGILHRFFSWCKVHSPAFARLTEGDKIILYEKGHFIEANMRRALTDREDVMQALRESGSSIELSNVEQIFMERNGTITFIKTGTASVPPGTTAGESKPVFRKENVAK